MNKFFKKHHLKRIEKEITVKVLVLEEQKDYRNSIDFNNDQRIKRKEIKSSLQ